jgi:hypothetical protein
VPLLCRLFLWLVGGWILSATFDSMRVPSPNQQAEVRRRKNVLAVMTVVWLLVVFGDDGRKPGSSGRKRVSVTSGDTHQVGVKRGPIASLGDEEPLELSATGATGVPSPTETSRNDGQLYKKHVLNAVGDNGAAQILADAVRESNGDSLFPKNLTVNLFGSWKQTKVRAALGQRHGRGPTPGTLRGKRHQTLALKEKWEFCDALTRKGDQITVHCQCRGVGLYLQRGFCHDGGLASVRPRLVFTADGTFVRVYECRLSCLWGTLRKHADSKEEAQ